MVTRVKGGNGKRKPPVLGNVVIDLAAWVKVIDDSGPKLVWKTVAPCAPSVAKAREVLKAHGLSGGWLVDGLGDKVWVDA